MGTMETVFGHSVLMLQELLYTSGSMSLCRVSSPNDDLISGPDVPKLASGLYMATYGGLGYGQFEHEVVRLHYQRYYLNELPDLFRRPFQEPELPSALDEALGGDEE